MTRVMLADDEPIMRKALQLLPDWKGMGCEICFTAANGREVLDRLEEIKPDILITDIKMPGADGIELARYVWERKLPVKVILLTAYADFSYAQSAVRYDVAEYVTKTGTLDGLEAAVKKCREQLSGNREQAGRPSVAVENFFRAVYDGSLFETGEIADRAAELGIGLAAYRVLLFHLYDSGQGEAKGRELHRKTAAFLEEAFSARMVVSLFVKRDRLCVILKEPEESGKEKLTEECSRLIGMLESLVSVRICAGVSETSHGAEELKRACEQADTVLDLRFLDDRDKVNFYDDKAPEKEVLLPDCDERIGNICRELKKGDGRNALALFEELLEAWKQYGCTAASVKSAGMSIQNSCRKMIAEYDEAFSGPKEHQGGIAQMIYGCMYLEEYAGIMRGLIGNTARVTGAVRNRKSDLVLACEHYIEEHFTEAVSVADIAEAVGANPSYLSRVFRENTGNTVIGTMNQRKLDKAKEYLEQTDLKIYEIADALGFENVTYFSHFFKKQTGTAPKDWGRKDTSGRETQVSGNRNGQRPEEAAAADGSGSSINKKSD